MLHLVGYNIFSEIPKVERKGKDKDVNKTIKVLRELNHKDKDINDLALLFAEKLENGELTIEEYVFFKMKVVNFDPELCNTMKNNVCNIYRQKSNYNENLLKYRVIYSEMNKYISLICQEFTNSACGDFEKINDMIQSINSDDKYSIYKKTKEVIESKFSYLEGTLYEDFYKSCLNDLNHHLCYIFKAHFRNIVNNKVAEEKRRESDYIEYQKSIRNKTVVKRYTYDPFFKRR